MSCDRQNKEIIRGTSVTFTVTVTDQNDDALDLTGASAHCWVKTSASAETPVIAKSSGNPGEIDILVPETDGQLEINFDPVDTQSLDAGTYYYDVLVQLATGERYVVVKPSKFIVEAGIVDLAGASPPTPGDPAPQNEDEKSFQFTVPGDGDSWSVSVPGGGMYDGDYIVMASITTLPAGGSLALLYAPDSSKTSTGFTLESSGELLQNTVIDLLLRDR